MRAGAEALGVALAGHDRIISGLRFEIFEAVAGNEDRLARFIEPVIGAADALQEPRRALGRAHLDHAVDVAPVDAEIEAGGRDEPAQAPVGHRSLDLAPRLAAEAAMVDADGEIVVILRPQLLESELGEAARIAEDERHAVGPDDLDHLPGGIDAAMPRPGHAALGRENREVRRRARLAFDQSHVLRASARRKPCTICIGSATVADNPTRRSIGRIACNLDRDRLSRSPRLSGAKA